MLRVAEEGKKGLSKRVIVTASFYSHPSLLQDFIVFLLLVLRFFPS